MYSCVGIRAERFVCSVLTLEAIMSGGFITGGIHEC